MRIIRLQVEGFKRLVAVDITPDGDLIEVRGNNGEGKSSVLDAIFAALAGKAAAPVKPVREGEEYALIRVDLGDLKVTRYFDADGTSRLKVENAEGAVFQQGQTMLDALVGAISFDPLEFAHMDPKTQAATLRSLVKLDVDFDELAKADAADYAARRDVNRDAKALVSRIEAIVVPADLPDVAPDAEAIADALAKAGEANAAMERERNVRENDARVVVTIEADAVDKRSAARHYREKADQLDREAAAAEESAERERARLAALPALAEPVDVIALRASLAEAEQVKAAVARRNERATLKAEFDALKAKSERLTAAMDKRAEAKAKALASAKMPVDGLSLAEVDGDLIVTLNGIPFSQVSGAEQLKTSVAVAMAANPKLRVLRVKDGSLLDRKSVDVLRQIATDNDFQIWAEFVGDEGAGVIMEAGRVKGAAEPEKLSAPKRKRKAQHEGAGEAFSGIPTPDNADPRVGDVPAGSLL